MGWSLRCDMILPPIERPSIMLGFPIDLYLCVQCVRGFILGIYEGVDFALRSRDGFIDMAIREGLPPDYYLPDGVILENNPLPATTSLSSMMFAGFHGCNN